MPTYMAKKGKIEQRWFVIDATDQVVGRLAVQIATILRGKHRPEYTPHVDTGEFVIVINADKVRFTGKKLEPKTYAAYSHYPGGLKTGQRPRHDGDASGADPGRGRQADGAAQQARPPADEAS